MERSFELEDLLRRFYDAYTNVEIETLNSMISRDPDVLAIGTDPDEWWVGHDSITTIVASQAKETAGTRWEAGDPHGFAVGDIGWVSGRPRWVFADGRVIPFRLTAVCHLEGGAWRIVQSHFSIGVPNEDAVGRALTT